MGDSEARDVSIGDLERFIADNEVHPMSPDNDRIDWLQWMALTGPTTPTIERTDDGNICLSFGEADEVIAPTLREAIDQAMQRQMYGVYADDIPMT